MMRRSKAPRDNDKTKRVRQPRSTPKETDNSPYDFTWLSDISARMAASRVLNGIKEFPYWLSIPHHRQDGVEPITGFVPCVGCRSETRAYYGFAFRAHRDAVFERWDQARKEYTDFKRPS